jgi:hypothetical protein
MRWRACSMALAAPASEKIPMEAPAASIASAIDAASRATETLHLSAKLVASPKSSLSPQIAIMSHHPGVRAGPGNSFYPEGIALDWRCQGKITETLIV